MSSPFIPIKTADLARQDGSSFCDDINFSADREMEQRRHVFVDGNDLINRWLKLPHDAPTCFNIAEIGFGAGLNFLLTWQLWEQYAPSTARLHFISCEKNPLNIVDLKRCLSFWPELAEHANQLIRSYPVLTPGYHYLSFSNGRVTLMLMLGETLENYEQLLICGESVLEADLRTAFIDAWYLNDFSFKRNEPVCFESLLKVIAMLSKEGTTLATDTECVSVESAVNVGFVVDEKKEHDQKHLMMRGCFKKNRPIRIKTRHTPWHVSIPVKQQQKKSALIIGAGLAGSYTAYSLAKRGWQVTLIDELGAAGQGGSANQQAILFPKLSAYKSPLTQLMISAFLYANRTYTQILSQHKLGELKGTLLLAHNEREKKAQDSLEEWLFHYPELGELVDEQRASELAGVSLDKTGLFIPLSGWINSSVLCQELLKHDGITLVTNCSIDSLFFDNHQWVIHDIAAPVLILANGPRINSFKETSHLPIKTIRGQMTAVQSTTKSKQLRIPVCAQAHVLPETNGAHYFGATYELAVAAAIYDHDDEENMMRLNQITKDVLWSNSMVDHWAGLRAATPDYLPLVGQVPRMEEFLSLFAGLESNSKRWIAKAGSYYPGLYACAGFGSRGLTTVPLCAEWLAGLINKEVSCLPRNLVHALSPSRFLRRGITRRF